MFCCTSVAVVVAELHRRLVVSRIKSEVLSSWVVLTDGTALSTHTVRSGMFEFCVISPAEVIDSTFTGRCPGYEETTLECIRSCRGYDDVSIDLTE